MATKAQVYATLADDTARKITGDYLDWAAFLDTSSRLYKYPFHDQLLIYAQRPDATACAEYDIWNDTMRRYIRRGSKGIALLSPGPGGMSVRYVFDVSDTGERRGSRRVEPWVLAIWSLSSRCWKTRTTLTPPCPYPARSARSQRSRR